MSLFQSDSQGPSPVDTDRRRAIAAIETSVEHLGLAEGRTSIAVDYIAIITGASRLV